MIAAYDIDDLYKKAAHEVLTQGKSVTARGLDFREILFTHLKLLNPRARIVQNIDRKLSLKFLIGEFIWMMTGKCNVEQIAFYNKRMADFSDNGISLHGAYGPRLRNWQGFDQIQGIVNRLTNDIYNRQSSIVILDPKIDLTAPTKDIPCNNYLQFICRENKLHLACYVRSNDLNLGFPYDVFHWTMLQEIVATQLGVELGEYNHFVGSLHIYNNDIEKMQKIVDYDYKRGGPREIIHVEMAPMPKDTSIEIFNKLEVFEKNFRETGTVDFTEIPSWWHRSLNWLKG